MSRYIDIIPGETPLAKELRQVAEILEARGMSAEMINMTLAARLVCRLRRLIRSLPRLCGKARKKRLRAPGSTAPQLG